MEWAGNASSDFTTVAGTGNAVVTFPTGTAVGDAIERLTSPTIVRIRGMLFCAANTAADTLGFYGIGVASLQALAAGATSLPNAEDDADFPWIFWTPMIASDGAAGGTDFAMRTVIDSKAMRKIKSRDESLFVSVANASAVSLRFAEAWRVLLKE